MQKQNAEKRLARTDIEYANHRRSGVHTRVWYAEPAAVFCSVVRCLLFVDSCRRPRPTSTLPSFAHSEDEPLVEDALEYAGAYVILS